MNHSTGPSVIRQFLNFRLIDEVFGVDVFQVREILEFTKITKVPQSPEYLCGVINLRGAVVPVVDMRLKFGLPKTDPTVNTCIIVIEVTIEDERTIMGALVDAVQEVVELDEIGIEPPPKIGTHLNTEFIYGMGKQGDNFIILLNLDKIFSTNEIAHISNLAKENN